MEWRDEGVVLGLRRHGDSTAVLEVMTREHGRHLGLVRGARSPKTAVVLQPGNGVQVTWRARMEDQLGSFAVEGTALRAGRFLDSNLALSGLAWFASLLRFLPEREAHPNVLEAFEILVEHLDEPTLAPALGVRFEASLLAELGFGLDLERCAVSGAREDLAFVSPNTGRAVTRAVGAPLAERLLRLPAFLVEGQGVAAPNRGELEAGFALTGRFLARHLFPHLDGELPGERRRFEAAALHAASPPPPLGARAAAPPASRPSA